MYIFHFYHTNDKPDKVPKLTQKHFLEFLKSSSVLNLLN